MKSNRATIIATRIVGMCALGWVYAGTTGLMWLLHIHRLHALIARSSFRFNYEAYLGCNIAYLAAAIVASAVLIFFPGTLLTALTPGGGRKPGLSVFWTSGGVIVGIVLCLLGVHSILSTAMWTIYQSGTDSGWEWDVTAGAGIAAGGVYLCRRMLARG